MLKEFGSTPIKKIRCDACKKLVPKTACRQADFDFTQNI